MHTHILGICGTFMGGLAILARECGQVVTGSDQNVYPPMSTQLQQVGIALTEGYDAAQFAQRPDLVVIGNALSRGNAAVEHVLNEQIPYVSGPEWLAQHVLQGKWVIGVAGTHGKTTTTSMVAWILDDAGLNPGFLIGGVPKNFGISARLGGGKYFVVEADEYDSAFFDKRSKFVHYRPKTAILNNLEFDHGDIFENLDAIKKQFHHLVRTIPGNGRIIHPVNDANIVDTLQKGCWTPVETMGIDAEGGAWTAQLVVADGSVFRVLRAGKPVGEVTWTQAGEHNVRNGLAAIAAAVHAGVDPAAAVAALCRFEGVKRRLDLLGVIDGVSVYDDFAHHPTAIAMTLAGMRKRVGGGRILLAIEPRSNTMRMGMHRDHLAPSTADADAVFWFQPAGLDWALDDVIAASVVPAQVVTDIDDLVSTLAAAAKPGDSVVIMSNGGFGGIHQKLLGALRIKESL
ncbi:MAG: UDP-N-acetylmuramate:L-alanyl-gamma-D-glutamyl-meso-diaminopimelate ligase [Actinomycetota bacterium]|nr:UDP-N-acetylmuramate:L-alanyl-gamma-D-glutamyl-meso-diaminopimelate ligase [Actinomycetota bacterium]